MVAKWLPFGCHLVAKPALSHYPGRCQGFPSAGDLDSAGAFFGAALDISEHLCYYESPRPVAGRICAPPLRVSTVLD